MRFLQAAVSKLCRRCLTRPLRNEWSAHRICVDEKRAALKNVAIKALLSRTNYLDEKTILIEVRVITRKVAF